MQCNKMQCKCNANANASALQIQMQCFSTCPFHLHRHPHHVASGVGFRWKGYVLKNAKIRILFWAMAARNWGSGSPQLFIKFRCWANRLQTSLVLFWCVKTLHLPRITFHLIRLLANRFQTILLLFWSVKKCLSPPTFFLPLSRPQLWRCRQSQSWGLPGVRGGPKSMAYNSNGTTFASKAHIELCR